MPHARRTRRAPVPRVAPPRGLRAAEFRFGSEDIAVLSFELPRPVLPEWLSAAERDISRALLDGLSNDAIAAKRGTSTSTVANQISALFRKLKVRSRPEFIAVLTRTRALQQKP